MSAVIKASYDSKRQRLADIIPLSSPFTVFIEPTRFCNFKCFFCMHGTRGNPDGVLARSGHKLKHMDWELYEKLMGQLAEFPKHPLRIVFSGLGEPLINPLLPKMIRFAKDMNIFKRLDIITNASLLTHKLSEELIESGVGRIQVSLEGLDSAKYKEVTGIDVDFDVLYDNLKYLYSIKKDCHVFVKIIDALLDGKEGEERFYSMFGTICDQMFIEHLITLQHPMGNHGGLANDSRNLNNEPVVPRNVCPVIFYMLQIDVDGNVFPCPVSGLPASFSMGNINTETLEQIWKSDGKRKKLIKAHLMHKRKDVPVCDECHAMSCILDPAEDLDPESERLLSLFNGKENF